MAAHLTETRSRVVEALGFWIVTLLVCGIAGLASYRFGRDWIGDRVGADVKPVLTTQALVDRMGGGAEEPEPAGAASDDAPAQPPPQKAVVDITPTTPTTEDRQRLRLEGRREGPAASREASAGEKDEPARRAETSADRDREPAEAAPAKRAEAPRARAPSVPDPSASGSSDGKFTVRAGSFADRANADRMVTKLTAQGYQPFVTQIVKDGREYHRVNVATVAERDEALKLRGELRSAGYDADVSSD